jgi:hypothetical protein
MYKASICFLSALALLCLLLNVVLVGILPIKQRVVYS